MKNLFIAIVFVMGITAFSADKVRQFDADKNPLPQGKTGVYQLVTTTDAEWNDSGCPNNTILENGVVRLKVKAEKDAEAKVEKDKADAKSKEDFEKTDLGKRIVALEAEVEKLKKK